MQREAHGALTVRAVLPCSYHCRPRELVACSTDEASDAQRHHVTGPRSTVSVELAFKPRWFSLRDET